MRYLIFAIMGLLVGCSSRLPTVEEQAASKIVNSNQLVEVEYIEDATGLQWVSPRLNASDYNKLIVMPVGLNQDASQDRQLPVKVLVRVSERLTMLIADELARGIAIIDTPDQHTATLHIEITRASTDMEDLKITEMLPYGAIIGGTKALLGTRDRNVRLMVESQLVDSLSGEVLAERVSILLAKDILENDTEKLKYEQIEEMVDRFTQDIVYFIQLSAYQASHNP
ncbi:DUF3313 family protein [Photobacterium nomapromontoriensis]|uniref:DUF3313 family protein n=1 Tax=Photobacterium nomapromontoriensis TaxID=2910237 RepID=UPI003D0A8E76